MSCSEAELSKIAVDKDDVKLIVNEMLVDSKTVCDVTNDATCTPE